MKLFRMVCLLALVSMCAYAQDKVGYVNMDALFNSYYKTVTGSIVFEQKKHEVDDKLGVLRSGLDALVRELKKLEGDAKNELLDDKAREEAINKYRTRAELFAQKREEFEQERQANLQELRKMQLTTEETLVKELTVLVKNYAKTNGYTHVIDISGHSMNRVPVLLVYPVQQEITEALVTEANKGHEKELEEGKSKLESLKIKK